jgi:hypothetical protein
MWHWVKFFSITSVVTVSFHNGSLVNTPFQSKKIGEVLRLSRIFFRKSWNSRKGKSFPFVGSSWGEENNNFTNILNTTLCRCVPLTILRFLLMDVTSKKSRTPWSRVLVLQVTGLEIVKKVSAFYGTWTVITAFTRARHLSQSYAKSFQFVPHTVSWRSIFIVSSHLHLGLPSSLFSLKFATPCIIIQLK